MTILKAADIGDAALLRQVGRSAAHRPVDHLLTYISAPQCVETGVCSVAAFVLK